MRCHVVGPAKSGTTALLTLIQQAMSGPRLFFEEPLSAMVPALQDLQGDCVAKVIFGNEADDDIASAARAFDHKILLIRDPRDNLVSRLLYVIASRRALVGDDAFIDHLIAMLKVKQATPASLDFSEIAGVFDAETGGFITQTLRTQNNFAQFVVQRGDGWHVMRYEDLVTGRVKELSRYLGRPMQSAVTVDPEYARVARTKSTGDWARWFTEGDVAALRPAWEPLLCSLGYHDDWLLDPDPRIAEEHSWGYVLRLVHERRQHYGLPPYVEPASRSISAVALRPSLKHESMPASNLFLPSSAPPAGPVACNICGGKEFGAGPNGRTSDNGALPNCRQCGSLERQRIVRRIFQAMPVGFLDWRRGLQFSPDNGIHPAAFRSYEVSVFGGENSLDIQAIDRDSGSCDFVSFSHVLEFVPDDLRSFSELTRLLSPRGLMLACFSAPLSRRLSIDYAEPFGPHRAWHLYGTDLAQRFQCAEKGLTMLAVEETDPCTGSQEVVHLFLRQREDAQHIQRWLNDWSGTARIRTESTATEAPMLQG
jgi:hypothetical protein